jgi:hypothetical protein
METPHEAIDWLRKRIAWERWLTDLRRHDAQLEPTEADVEVLAQPRQHRPPAVVNGDWWDQRSA